MALRRSIYDSQIDRRPTTWGSHRRRQSTSTTGHAQAPAPCTLSLQSWPRGTIRATKRRAAAVTNSLAYCISSTRQLAAGRGQTRPAATSTTDRAARAAAAIYLTTQISCANWRQTTAEVPRRLLSRQQGLAVQLMGWFQLSRVSSNCYFWSLFHCFPL